MEIPSHCSFLFEITVSYCNEIHRFVFTSSCLQESSCLINVISVCLRIVVSNKCCVVLCLVLFFFVLRSRCYKFLWIVHCLLPLRYALTFIQNFYIHFTALFSNIASRSMSAFSKTFYHLLLCYDLVFTIFVVPNFTYTQWIASTRATQRLKFINMIY